MCSQAILPGSRSRALVNDANTAGGLTATGATLASLIIVCPAAAQPPERLTLERAVTEALVHNDRILDQQDSVEQASSASAWRATRSSRR